MIDTWQTREGWHAKVVHGNVIRMTRLASETEGQAKAALAFPTLPPQQPDPEPRKWWQVWK